MFHVKAAQDISSGFDLDLVGFHGQTLYHNPNQKTSIQIGNGNLLSQMLKKKLYLISGKTILEMVVKGRRLHQFFTST